MIVVNGHKGGQSTKTGPHVEHASRNKTSSQLIFSNHHNGLEFFLTIQALSFLLPLPAIALK